MNRRIKTLEWQGDKLILIDQTLLPDTISYKTVSSVREVYQAIKTMVVRGAPAIGVAAAYGMVIAASESENKDFEEFIKAYKNKRCPDST